MTDKTREELLRELKTTVELGPFLTPEAIMFFLIFLSVGMGMVFGLIAGVITFVSVFSLIVVLLEKLR